MAGSYCVFLYWYLWRFIRPVLLYYYRQFVDFNGFINVKINSLKVFVVGIYIFTSLIVFVASGNVNWLIGFHWYWVMP